MAATRPYLYFGRNKAPSSCSRPHPGAWSDTVASQCPGK